MSYSLVPERDAANDVVLSIESKRSSASQEIDQQVVRACGLDEAVFVRHLLEWSTVHDVLAFGSTNKINRTAARSQQVWEFLLHRDLAPLRLCPAEGRVLYQHLTGQGNGDPNDPLLSDALYAASRVPAHLVTGDLSYKPMQSVDDKGFFALETVRSVPIRSGSLQVRIVHPVAASHSLRASCVIQVVPDCWVRPALWSRHEHERVEFHEWPGNWREAVRANGAAPEGKVEVLECDNQSICVVVL